MLLSKQLNLFEARSAPKKLTAKRIRNAERKAVPWRQNKRGEREPRHETIPFFGKMLREMPRHPFSRECACVLCQLKSKSPEIGPLLKGAHRYKVGAIEPMKIKGIPTTITEGRKKLTFDPLWRGNARRGQIGRGCVLGLERVSLYVWGTEFDADERRDWSNPRRRGLDRRKDHQTADTIVGVISCKVAEGTLIMSSILSGSEDDRRKTNRRKKDRRT